MPKAPEVSEPTGAERRRSKRVALTFHIEVAGRDPRGANFRVPAITVDVNEHGCCFNSSQQLNSGDRVTIRLTGEAAGSPDAQSPQTFEVVWALPSDRGWSIGVNKLQANRPFWPVSFPHPTTPVA